MRTLHLDWTLTNIFCYAWIIAVTLFQRIFTKLQDKLQVDNHKYIKWLIFLGYIWTSISILNGCGTMIGIRGTCFVLDSKEFEKWVEVHQ